MWQRRVVSATTPEDVVIRTAVDADWTAMYRLEATAFGRYMSAESVVVWRARTPPDAAVVACAGAEVVGYVTYSDYSLTVPGGAVLPLAGLTSVAVAPTHRRRGVLTAMLAEVHRRIERAGYPLAGLTASEGAIYGRFGYGPATVAMSWAVQRRVARFRSDVPDPVGVQLVSAQEHLPELVDVYERWRLVTPGGLYTPPQLWDEILADREDSRRGASAFFTMLHPDGFAMYRVRDREVAVVTKLCAVTSDAHIALWRALLGLDLLESVTITTHPRDPLPYLLTDARQVRTTAVEDGMWLRLVDPVAALQARRYTADVCTTLGLGAQTIRFEVRGGRAQCTPTDRPADVHVDGEVLASLYFGAHRATDFAAARRLLCADAALPAQLDAAFASPVPAEAGYEL